nr:hypothetical protein [Pokkaliibacter plantistimulans]
MSIPKGFSTQSGRRAADSERVLNVGGAGSGTFSQEKNNPAASPASAA